MNKKYRVLIVYYEDYDGQIITTLELITDFIPDKFNIIRHPKLPHIAHVNGIELFYNENDEIDHIKVICI